LALYKKKLKNQRENLKTKTGHFTYKIKRIEKNEIMICIKIFNLSINPSFLICKKSEILFDKKKNIRLNKKKITN